MLIKEVNIAISISVLEYIDKTILSCAICCISLAACKVWGGVFTCWRICETMP